MGTLATITAALSDVQICPHSCCVIVLDVFFLLLLCFYIVYSCHVSIVLCHIAVLSIMDTGQCKNSCLVLQIYERNKLKLGLKPVIIITIGRDSLESC